MADLRQDRAGGQGDARKGEQGDHTEWIACPFCDSPDTELFSLFSQFLLASQYYCRNCRTVFDVVRWEDHPQSPTSNL